MLTKVDKDKKVKYVWFDTGLEYQATKDHLNELENKYNINIERRKAVKAIPLCCKEYGQPFLNKMVSCLTEMLQKHGFEWDYSLSLDELIEKYKPNKMPVSALKWWTNTYQPKGSSYNIQRNKYLKEYMSEHPPEFKISAKCCTYAKKKVNELFVKENQIDLDMFGVRAAEGGARSLINTCTTFDTGNRIRYRPIFWFKNSDKELYENHFGVTHSRCYTEYGLDRTGCVGCPFGKDYMNTLEKIKPYEPGLYMAAMNVFKESYKYTETFREYAHEKRAAEKKEDPHGEN